MIEENNKTLWCGNLPEQATEELLYELFLQAGPLEKVRIARDRDGRQRNFAFITYSHEVSVPYAIQLFRGTALFHKTLSLQSRGRMTFLPPPIRCFEPDDFLAQNNVAQQFSEMTDRIKDETLRLVHMARQSHGANDKLVMDSLQGNWSHRHHPYRPREREDYRSRDNRNSNYKSNRSNHSSNWRDRRSHKGSGYHRRD